MNTLKSEHVQQYAAGMSALAPTAIAVRDALASLPRSTSLPMLAAMHNTGKHVYAGTASPLKVAANRRRNKAARAARRIHRGRA